MVREGVPLLNRFIKHKEVTRLVAMETQQLSFVAGMISTIVFATSAIPMLAKALRTKDLRSYSFTNIAMSNVGNGVHWVYVVGLPFGPIWYLHAFYTIASAMMLLWYLRHQPLRSDWRRQPDE